MLQLNNVLHIPNTDHRLLLLGCWEQTAGQKISVQYGKITLLTEEGVAVEFLKSKCQATQNIKDYMTHLMVCGMSPCAIHMDCSMEFVNEDLLTWCHSKGIRYQMMAPYSPLQNGVAERMNRTLEELSRAMLIDSSLPEFLWKPTIAHAAYIQNMSWTKYNPIATPYQLWHGQKPSTSNL